MTDFRRHILSNQVEYSWLPPPTLNLTNIDPDILYKIEIYNITCGAHDLLSSNFNLTTSIYGNPLLDPSYVYKVVITPRSNVHGAKNGKQFVKIGKVCILLDLLLHQSGKVIMNLTRSNLSDSSQEFH